MEEKEEENLAAPERAVQPVNNRPGGTTGRLPPNYRPPFCDRAVQGRYCTGCTANYPMTGTTALTSGTTAGPYDVHLLKPAPDLPAVVPPSLFSTSALHELPAVQPPP